MTIDAKQKAKKVVRLTATVDLGEFDAKQPDGKVVKKHAYLTVYKDELPRMGASETKQTELQAVKITKGALKGRTIYRPIDDTSATGRNFQLKYLLKGATGKGTKRKPAEFDIIQVYFPTWMKTKQIFAAIAKFKRTPQFVISDLGTSVKLQADYKGNPKAKK